MSNIRRDRMMQAYRERRDPPRDQVIRSQNARLAVRRFREIEGHDWSTLNGQRRHSLQCHQDIYHNWTCALDCQAPKPPSP